MNITMSIGNLTDEPQVVEISGEHKKATFSLALNRIKDGADFPRFVAWDKKAELIEKYCHKGMKLAIRGHIQTGSYEKDGKKVYTTDIVVDDIEFCEKKNDGSAGQPRVNASEEFIKVPEGVDDEIPFA